MENLLARIWRDSVWSKVIASTVTGSVTLFPLGIWFLHPTWTFSVPVWLLVGLVVLVITGWSLFLWLAIIGPAQDEKSSLRECEPKLAIVNVSISPLDNSKKLTYPLKCYVTLRNDSPECADVRIAGFKPAAVILKKFVTEVLQVKLRDWSPADHGLERVALLSGQQVRAWIGVDETRFDSEKVISLRGRIGSLSFIVNEKTVAIDL